MLLINLLLGQDLAAAQAPPPMDVRRNAAVQAIEEVMPSVVNVSTETIVEIQDPTEQLFREFFGPNWGRRSTQRSQSLGSGVIIDESGYLLTNYHVVQRATKITVTLPDGRSFPATPVGRTLNSDVALLKISVPGEKLKAVKFAPDDDLLLGETVLALGNPFGLGGSVSRGILSSRTRRPVAENEPLRIEDWLQTDAAINPGNSGGPLVNLRGELIGLNVAVFRQGQGIGFAIPVKRVSEALSEMFTPEGLKSLWFGARFAASTNGVIAMAVQTGSPAEKAGLKKGDRILKINDKLPRSIIELNRELIASEPPRDIQLQVQRNSERRTMAVRLVPEEQFFNPALIRQKLGATLQELTPEMAAKMRLRGMKGLLIAGIDRDGPAEEAELRPGYLIQSIDGVAPEKITDAAKLLFAKNRGQRVNLNLIIPRTRGAILQLLQATTEVTVR